MTVGKIQLAEAAKAVVPSLTSEQALDIAERQLKIVRKSESHDLRFAKYMRRQIGKQLGQAGATIHQLRGELALVRQQKALMVHSAIDELIRGAVIEAVPIQFNDDGKIVGLAVEEEDRIGGTGPFANIPQANLEVALKGKSSD